jgi:hypothetical protein
MSDEGLSDTNRRRALESQRRAEKAELDGLVQKIAGALQRLDVEVCVVLTPGVGASPSRHLYIRPGGGSGRDRQNEGTRQNGGTEPQNKHVTESSSGQGGSLKALPWAEDLHAVGRLMEHVSGDGTTQQAQEGGRLPRQFAMRPFEQAPFHARIEAGDNLLRRIEIAEASGLAPLQALRLGHDVAGFLLDPTWGKDRTLQKRGVGESDGSYWQRLHRGALLLLEFNRLAALHPLPDPHWTQTRIYKEIGDDYACVVSPAGIESDKGKATNSGNNVKQMLQRCLDWFAEDTKGILGRIRRNPSLELARRHRSRA